MPLNILIYGAECSKCNKLVERFQKVISEFKVDATLEKITEIEKLEALNLYLIPVVVINGKPISKGVLLSEKQIIEQLNYFHSESERIPVFAKGFRNYFRRSLFFN